MSPKQKAIELFDKFANIEITMEGQYCSIGSDELRLASKQCALIACGLVLDKDGYNNHYWNSVKTEIEKL